MKILILTSRLPFPPDRGDRVRTYNFLRQMAVDHEISLISLIAHPRERHNAEALQSFCCRIQTVLLRPMESLVKAAAMRSGMGRIPNRVAKCLEHAG